MCPAQACTMLLQLLLLKSAYEAKAEAFPWMYLFGFAQNFFQ
jgi:hypothetical protein